MANNRKISHMRALKATHKNVCMERTRKRDAKCHQSKGEEMQDTVMPTQETCANVAMSEHIKLVGAIEHFYFSTTTPESHAVPEREGWMHEVVLWLQRAGYKCSINTIEHFIEVRPGVLVAQKVEEDRRCMGAHYVTFTLSIGDDTCRGYVRSRLYDSAVVAIEGVGECWTADTGEYPHVDVPEGYDENEERVDEAGYPKAHQMSYCNPTHPDIVFKHPATGDTMNWLEFQNERKAHFDSYHTMDGLRSFPSCLHEELIEEAMDVTLDLCQVNTIQNAHGSWGRPQIVTSDGYPMHWEYIGVGSVNAEAVLAFLEEKGCVSLEPCSEA